MLGRFNSFVLLVFQWIDLNFAVLIPFGKFQIDTLKDFLESA